MAEDMQLSFRKKALAAAFLVVSMSVFWFLLRKGYFSFDNLVRHRDALVNYVMGHYYLSVPLYMAVVMSTAFFVPGAIVVTLAGGLLFGVFPGVLYFNTGSVLGATTAFLLSRYTFGEVVQRRYEEQLEGLNKELKRHGHNYLIALRIVPVMPFFLMNYIAGLTRIQPGTFVWTTAVGMLPGSIVYCYAGSQLGRIEAPGDILSVEFAAAFALLALFALLPPLRRWGARSFGRN